MARPQALRFSRKLYRHAKGPIPEDDFPRPGEDVAKRQKGGSVERSETGGVFIGVLYEVRVSAGEGKKVGQKRPQTFLTHK